MNNEEAGLFLNSRKHEELTSFTSEFIVLNNLYQTADERFGENYSSIRLSGLVSYIEAVAKQEDVPSMAIASYKLIIYSKQVHNISIANLCKDIIAKGGYSPAVA
ncbi:hypothetical protein LOD99_7462 [Oopsacas minuta]|uniref:Uncharacterized protein n=1 Tax=Oopsacas minuta TaxID=111878 RepID=A0AAV7JUQ0_9METZ|nr:hypothetical protein LOD99_7462 [Oopsacas minuta]